MLISIDVKLISAFRRLFLGKFAGYLTIIPRDSQRGVQPLVGYVHLISNKREWNNCGIKTPTKYREFSDFSCKNN